MNYLYIPLLMLVFSQLCIYNINASITVETLSQISTVYHQAIRESARLPSLSNQEIDTALRLILQTNSLPSALLAKKQTYSAIPSTPARDKRSTDSEAQDSEMAMECSPQPQLIYQDEIKNAVPHSESRFLRMSVSDPRVCTLGVPCYAILLHRCPERTQLHCDIRHSTCLVSQTETITLDVTVSSLRESSLQTVNFVNHTECACDRPRKRCACPWPFRNAPTLSAEFQCECQCAEGEDNLCQQVQSGSKRLHWNETGLSTHYQDSKDYEICRNITEDSTWRHARHPDEIFYCPPVPCNSGLTFNSVHLACISNSSNIYSNNRTILDHRAMRGVKQSESSYSQTSTPEIDKLTLKRRIERKLHEIRKEGLHRSTSRIGRKLYKAFQQTYGEGNNRKKEKISGDISIGLKYSRNAQVKCKTVSSQYQYVLPLRSHFLFCAIDIH